MFIPETEFRIIFSINLNLLYQISYNILDKFIFLLGQINYKKPIKLDDVALTPEFSDLSLCEIEFSLCEISLC